MKTLIPLILACLLAQNASADDAEACNRALKAGDAATAAKIASEGAAANRDVQICLGRALSAQGEFARSAAAFQRADQLSTTPLEHVVTLTLLGNQQMAQGAHEDALASYRASLALAQAEKLKNYQRINLTQIGEVLEARQEFAGALEQYRQAQPLAANDNERADAHAHLAKVYSLLKQHDLAIEQQVKVVALNRKSGDFDHIAYAMLQLAYIYLQAGENANAGKALGKVDEAIAQAGDPYWQAESALMQGRLQQALGNPAAALKALEQGQALAEKLGASDLVKTIAEVKATVK